MKQSTFAIVKTEIAAIASGTLPHHEATYFAKSLLCDDNSFCDPVFVVENELDKTTSLPTTITSYLNMTRWGEIFLSEEWNDNEIGQSQLTHMKEVTVEELQFIDDDGDGDAIFLDIETEYL